MDDKRRYKALAKADLVGLYMDWQAKFGATVQQKQAFVLAYQAGTWSKLLLELGPRISWKSLEKWKLLHKNKGVLALVDERGLKNRGRTMLEPKHRSIIEGQVLHPNAPQIAQCMDRIAARCQAEGLAIPSEDTVRRYVKRYEQTSFDQWTLFREGKKAWNDKCCLAIRRNWELVEVGEVVIADGHTLNFETINPDTGKPTRMTLLLFLDGRSACPLGWEVMATENVACIASAFRRACIALGKFPRVVYIDNGKAFRARFFKGCNDFNQAGFLGLIRDTGCAVASSGLYEDRPSKPSMPGRITGNPSRLSAFFRDHAQPGSVHAFLYGLGHRPQARAPAPQRKAPPKLHEKMGGRPLTLEETLLRPFPLVQRLRAAPEPRPASARTHAGRSVFGRPRAGRGLEQADADDAAKGDPHHQQGRDTAPQPPVLGTGAAQPPPSGAGSLGLATLAAHGVRIRHQRGLHMRGPRPRPLPHRFRHPSRRARAGHAGAATEPGGSHRAQERAMAGGLGGHENHHLGSSGGSAAAPGHRRTTAQPAARAATGTQDPAPFRHGKKAAIEAAKNAGAQARAELDAPGYEPSLYRRFLDEPARYDYLFKARYEQGAELVPEDAAFMDYFENTPQFQRNFKPLYDSRLELLHRQGNIATA